jgi:Protein of unknown function (DUF4232)
MTRVLRAAAWPVLLAGLLLATVAALRSARYRSSFLEPRPACLRSGACTPGEIQGALAQLWWGVGAGVVLLLLGVALVAWRRPPVRTAPPARGLPPLRHAGLVAAVGSAVGLLLTVPAFVGLFAGLHAVPVVLAVVWLVQAEVVTGLDSRFGAPATSLRRATLTGLGASAAALCLALAAVTSGWVTPDTWVALPLANGVLLGLGAGVARLAGSTSRAVRTGAVLAALALAAVAVGGGVRASTSLLAAADPEPPPVTVPQPLPEPQPAVPSPPPAPVEPPPVPRVPADVACTTGDLALTVVGFDAALGARAASVQARNTGDVPCWVEGAPVVTLLQGGRPLHLAVEPGQPPAGGPAAPGRVGIAPGGTALALLSWRTYAGWADAEIPQTVTVALDAASPSVEAGIVGGPPQAPFDLADGGTWAVAPWAPPAG